MQSMFAFLNRREFGRLARCSKEFLQAGARTASRRWEYECFQADGLTDLLASPLRRHLAILRYYRQDRRREERPAALPLPALRLVATRLSHLEVLTCHLALEADMSEVSWPSHLRVIDLRLAIDDRPMDARATAKVGEALLHSAPAVETFTIQCTQYQRRDISLPDELLSPLAEWPLLKKIALHKPISTSTSAIVRRMAHLESIRVERTCQFVELMSPDGPVPPRLEEIGFTAASFLVSPEAVSLLVKLPTLRKLQAFFILEDPAPLVPILRQLRCLLVGRRPMCEFAHFVSALQQCTQLVELHLRDEDTTESHLASILAPMRRLRKLMLSTPRVESLAFLSKAVHLADTLKELRIERGLLDSSHPVVAQHLRPMHSLEKLVLPRSAPLDPASIAALTPGADGFERETWPRLRHFRWLPHQ